MSLDGGFDFTIRSSPEWLRDEGKGYIHIRDFDFNVNLIPSSNEGSIFLQVQDPQIHVRDYEVIMSGTSDIAAAVGIVTTEFKEYFKDMIADFLGAYLVGEAERSVNKMFFDEGRLKEVSEDPKMYLNLTVIDELIFGEDTVSILYDGTFVVDQEEAESPVYTLDMPYYNP